jgi:hypothetical protein
VMRVFIYKVNRQINMSVALPSGVAKQSKKPIKPPIDKINKHINPPHDHPVSAHPIPSHAITKERTNLGPLECMCMVRREGKVSAKERLIGGAKLTILVRLYIALIPSGGTGGMHVISSPRIILHTNLYPISREYCTVMLDQRRRKA